MTASAPNRRRPRPRRALRSLAVAMAVGTAVVAAACGGGDSAQVLSGDAGKGQQLARDRGCTSCHRADGGRSEGPSWKGLAGSTVQLADGTSVVADDAYLARSITDPRSQVVAGYKVPMQPQKLQEGDVPLLVAYIKALK
jgi:cytochrome c oxidase subunit 2